MTGLDWSALPCFRGLFNHCGACVSGGARFRSLAGFSSVLSKVPSCHLVLHLPHPHSWGPCFHDLLLLSSLPCFREVHPQITSWGRWIGGNRVCAVAAAMNPSPPVFLPLQCDSALLTPRDRVPLHPGPGLACGITWASGSFITYWQLSACVLGLDLSLAALGPSGVGEALLQHCGCRERGFCRLNWELRETLEERPRRAANLPSPGLTCPHFSHEVWE